MKTLSVPLALEMSRLKWASTGLGDTNGERESLDVDITCDVVSKTVGRSRATGQLGLRTLGPAIRAGPTGVDRNTNRIDAQSLQRNSLRNSLYGFKCVEG